MAAETERGLVRQQPCDQSSAAQRYEAEQDKRWPPTDVIGHDAGDSAAGEASQGGAADVDAHDGSDRGRRPVLRDVGDGGGEDARRDEPLQQTPEDQPAEGGGTGGGAGRHGEKKNRDENHALAIHTLGERAEQRRCDCDTESRSTDRPAYGRLRGVKEVFQQRQKRLRCIEREEGDEAAGEYADHAPDRVKRMTIAGCCVRKRCRCGRCAFAQRQLGRGGIVRATGIGHGRATFKINRAPTTMLRQ